MKSAKAKTIAGHNLSTIQMQNSGVSFYWFGDSWLYGSELDPAVRESVVFPQLVSKHYNANCVNLGQESNGPDILIWDFSRVRASIKPGDICFFFLSAPHRTFFFDEQGSAKKIIPSPGFESPSFHQHNKMYYKYFDTPTQRIYNLERSINLLWLWCRHLSTQCFFANIFTTQSTSLMDIVPAEAWLCPKNTCISEFILPFSSDRISYALTNDDPTLLEEQWHQQKTMVDLYIRPGHSHPNVRGHRAIADELIELIDSKLSVPYIS